MERRLITILAADLVGYSRLMAADEEGTIARLRTVRAEVVDPAIAAAEGRVVKTMGDGLLVAFGSPVAAVRMALAVQEAMVVRETGPEAERLRFRVGIHLGDVVIDGDDILGDGVNVAARLETLAPAGGICVSRGVQEQMRGKVAALVTALGPQPVKNLPQPVETWRIEVAGVTATPALAANARPAIAVLPFQNLSREPDQDFLADGIVEDVVTELGRFRDFTVIARNSTARVKDDAGDVREIAGMLGARYVVKGSVRRAGERLRLSAQLIDAADGTQVWAERWDRTMADLFDLQDELTAAIVGAVAPEISSHEQRLARRKPTESLTAWELAQRAHAEYQRYTPASIETAKGLAARAIEVDPGIVLAHSLLARAYGAEVMGGRAADREEGLRLAMRAAQRAIASDSRNDAGHAALGYALSIAGRFDEAIEALERACALNPNNATSFYLLSARRLDHPTKRDPERTLADIRTALRLSPNDPFVWVFHCVVGLASLQLGDHETALEACDTARKYRSGNWKPSVSAAVAAIAAWDTERARAMVAEALELEPGLTLDLVRSGIPALANPPLAEVIDQLPELGLPARAT